MKAMTQENIFDPPFAYIGADLWKLQPKTFEKSGFLVIFCTPRTRRFWRGRKSNNPKQVQKVQKSAKFRFPVFSPKLSSGVP